MSFQSIVQEARRRGRGYQYKGIGCGVWLALRCLNIKLAVRKSKRGIYGGGCSSFLGLLSSRHFKVETV
jgi:hypothetical protein